MIYPTPRAMFLMLMGTPVFIAVALLAPSLWVLGGAWIIFVAALLLADSMLGAQLRAFKLNLTPPSVLYAGGSDPLPVQVSFEIGPLPQRVETHLETSPFLADLKGQTLRGWRERAHKVDLRLHPTRRGTARLERFWCRWTGPLGLVYKQRAERLDIDIPIIPDIRWVKEEAIRIYSRDAEFGLKTQIDRGDGSEFDALREFTAGMDRRAIDWKHSARHRQLLAKEFRTERNHNIVFAFDTGRLMSEPLGGVPKIDRAINAGLLLSFVSLRSGDRAMIYGFNAKPGATSGFLSGSRSFPKVQNFAAGLDYSIEESNFTLALTNLANRLQRRSLIIIFSDFVDTTTAELMVENIKRLTDRHLVVFATFEDEAMVDMMLNAPDDTEDVARSVISDRLLSERDMVFRRLQRLGVQIIETRPAQLGTELISRYLHIKGRDML